MLFKVTKPCRESNDRTGTYLESVFAIVNKSERDDADRRPIKAAKLVGPQNESFNGVSLQWASAIEGLEEILSCHWRPGAVGK
jgi:hypothetical protein